MSRTVQTLMRVIAVFAVAVGSVYLAYRWLYSIDGVSPILSVPLATAETLSFVGILIFFFILWFDKDPPIRPPPFSASTIDDAGHSSTYRPISVDIFFTTLDEPVDMLRRGVEAAKRLHYPSTIRIAIYILDDGRREEMRALAERLGVFYLSRPDNLGFKAGNIKNAFDRSDGDIVVIFDADSVPKPSFLANTLGYFRDPKVAWVQTPQFFPDIPDGIGLPVGKPRADRAGVENSSRQPSRFLSRIRLFRDPLFNDASVFYNVIQRKRNAFYGSFCCGAGSLHRRAAVTETAIRRFTLDYRRVLAAKIGALRRSTGDRHAAEDTLTLLKGQAYQEALFVPYAYHISEDIYTSLLLHGDEEKEWRSVLHPIVECTMTSPQDVTAWSIQRFKYCAGSIDILLRSGLILQRGLDWPKRLYYLNTLGSYILSLLNALFFVYPLLYLYFGLAPVNAYSNWLIWLLFGYIVLLEAVSILGGWGNDMARARAGHFVSFPLHLKALAHVLLGKPLKFKVTPKERGTFSLRVVRGQSICAGLGLGGLAVGIGMLLWGGEAIDTRAVVFNSIWVALNTWAFLRFLIGAALLPRMAPRQTDGSIGELETPVASEPATRPQIVPFRPPTPSGPTVLQGLRAAASSILYIAFLSLLPLFAYFLGS